MSYPAISIIVITYNNFKELKLTLSSLDNKTLGKEGLCEVIVVNGGTCKMSQKFLQELCALHGDVFILVQGPDEGIADAFNKGVMRARGKYITFLNSGDVLIEKSYYRWADKFFNENPNVDFVHGDMIFTDSLCGNMQISPRMYALGRGTPYHHLTMIVRRSVFQRVGLFNLKYKVAMDFEFICRMEKIKSKGKYLGPIPIVMMNGKGISATREFLAIKECCCAIREVKGLSCDECYYLLQRAFWLFFRKFLPYIGLKRILIHLKKQKNKKIIKRNNKQ